MINTIKHVVSPGVGPDGRLFVTIEVKREDGKTRLSITGVEGPKSNGDARGSCGQCVDALDRVTKLSEGWTPEMVQRLKAEWERWHLNDMRAGCEHQRKVEISSRLVEVVTYHLTTEAFTLRKKTREELADAALRGEMLKLSETARALAGLDDWFEPRYSPPDADSPLSGCYEVKKREQKAIGWVTRDEHPEGLLSVPCPDCGYKYGSAWLYEEVPEDVLAFLGSLPQDDRLPRAWAA